MIRDLYINCILRRDWAARLFPFRQPPVLLLSYPRSGSSWIGDILDSSPNVAYLREPVNQPFLRQLNGTLIDPNRDEETLALYSKLADDAFRGIPAADFRDFSSLRDFSLSGRGRRRLLIKEVNPVAANFFIRRYSPQIVFVLRHPAALADSFMRMGWLTESLENFGRDYGVRMLNALEAIKEVNSKVILYERVAADPVAEFTKIFSYLDVGLPPGFNDIIGSFCGDQGSDNPYATKRVSSDQIDKWKKNLGRQEIEVVMKGYRASGLEYYADDE